MYPNYGLAFDKSFFDYGRINALQIFSLIIALSDNDTQYPCVHNIFDRQRDNFWLVKKRLITKSALAIFIEILKNQS